MDGLQFHSQSLIDVDRTNTLTERLEKVLYRIDVSHGLLSCSLFNAYCKDVSMLLFGSSFSNILPGDDHISEDALVVSVEHQDCTRSTIERSMSTNVIKLEDSDLTDTEIQTVSGSPDPPRYRLPMMSRGLAYMMCC